MKLMFLSITGELAERFAAQKTKDQLALHGPLAFGQKIPVHDHDGPAVYRVTGVAEFIDGAGGRRILGEDATANAVFVPAGQKHGWLGLRANTLIEHVLGDQALALATA